MRSAETRAAIVDARFLNTARPAGPVGAGRIGGVAAGHAFEAALTIELFEDRAQKRRQLADGAIGIAQHVEPAIGGDGPGAAGETLRASAGDELLRQHPLLEVVLGIEQQRHGAVV